MSDAFQVILIGVVGGLAAELLRWFNLRDTLHNELPEWSRSWLYWLVTVFMSLVGGLLVYLYIQSGTKMSAILAFNIGISAPLILAKLASEAPPIVPGKVL